MPFDRLQLLDKCVDGDILKLKELCNPMYDDFGSLYDTLHSFMEELTLETVSYTRDSDYTNFVVKSKDIKSSHKIPCTGRVSAKVSAGKASFNIPIKEG